jgi:aspartate kinase
MAVLAMAIADLGFEVKSFTGSQAGVITDSVHGKARIIDVTPGRLSGALAEGTICIVAGFQGVSQDTKDITTLGRGGSDTTAVALAASLNADVCEIYTDVDGVFSADPRIVPAASRRAFLTYEEMLELAAQGAKVLHLRCVEYARRFDLPIHVRSSFSMDEGTMIVGRIEGDPMEQPIISGVAHDRTQAKITVLGVPDRPGEAAAIFQSLARSEVNIDMIVQNVSAVETGRTDITFTLPVSDGKAALAGLETVKGSIGFESLQYDEKIGKLSLIGAGMRSHPGVSATFFSSLADAGVNVQLISTSEIRISVVVLESDLDNAVRAVHAAFGLDTESGEAVVYGGTGR